MKFLTRLIKRVHQHLNAKRATNVWGTFIGIAAFGSIGCKDSESAALPDHILQLPYDIELSTTEGVSIIQSRSGTASDYNFSSDGFGGRSASATNSGLEAIVNQWTEFEGWIFVEAEFPDRTYNVKIEAPEGQTFANLYRQAFESTFGLKYTETVESTDVWVLSKDDSTKITLKPAESHSSNWGTDQTPGGFGYEFRSGSMEDLTDILSSAWSERRDFEFSA
jgi:hypothetical protein